jgi:hypothetical protein
LAGHAPILIPRGGHRPWGSYQVSRAKRCADRRFSRSRASVRGEGMRSNNLVLTSGRTRYRGPRARYASSPSPARRWGCRVGRGSAPLGGVILALGQLGRWTGWSTARPGYRAAATSHGPSTVAHPHRSSAVLGGPYPRTRAADHAGRQAALPLCGSGQKGQLGDRNSNSPLNCCKREAPPERGLCRLVHPTGVSRSRSSPRRRMKRSS